MTPTPEQIDMLVKAHLISTDQAKTLRYRAAPWLAWEGLFEAIGNLVAVSLCLGLFWAKTPLPGLARSALLVVVALALLSFGCWLIAIIRKEPTVRR